MITDSAKFNLLCGVTEIFQSFDVDGDKSISWAEFKKYMVEGEGHTVQTAKEFFEQIDTDKDGTITFKEFWDHNKEWDGQYQ